MYYGELCGRPPYLSVVMDRDSVGGYDHLAKQRNK